MSNPCPPARTNPHPHPDRGGAESTEALMRGAPSDLPVAEVQQRENFLLQQQAKLHQTSHLVAVGP